MADWRDNRQAAQDRADSGAAAAGAGSALSIPMLPYVFNPPPHPSILHKVPDLTVTSGQSWEASQRRIYDEAANEYAPDSVGESGAFRNLRLGRIVQWEKVFAYSNLTLNKRFGFRFLYNPTSISGGVSVGTDFIPDPGNSLGGMLQSGLESISLELLINRTPEVQGNARLEDYKSPTITEDDLEELRTRGTAFDVEYIYRVANGAHNTSFRSNTGDIGILLPNPCEMFLGPYRTRGGIFTVSVTDQMFSADMVPMLSFVQIQFNRYLSFTPDAETLAVLESTGVTVRGTTDGPSGYGVTSVTLPPGVSAVAGGSVLAASQVEQLAKSAGFTPHEARIATMVAWGESRYAATASNETGNDMSYGLWQINIKSGINDPKILGISGKTDLFDPVINARCAYYLFKENGRKFSPVWSAYTNGSYKDAPAW